MEIVLIMQDAESKKYKDKRKGVLYYLKNAEIIKAKKRAKYRENPEKKKTYQREKYIKKPKKLKSYPQASLVGKKAYHKAYRLKNLEKLKAYDKTYRLANLEKCRMRNKIYAKNNPDKIKIKNRMYGQNNPEKIRNWCRKRRTLKMGNAHESYTETYIFERDSWVCGICGQKINKRLKYPNPRSKSIDHIIPLSNGGSDSPINTQASHLRCNSSKSNRGGGQLRLIS